MIEDMNHWSILRFSVTCRSLGFNTFNRWLSSVSPSSERQILITVLWNRWKRVKKCVKPKLFCYKLEQWKTYCLMQISFHRSSRTAISITVEAPSIGVHSQFNWTSFTIKHGSHLSSIFDRRGLRLSAEKCTLANPRGWRPSNSVKRVLTKIAYKIGLVSLTIAARMNC